MFDFHHVGFACPDIDAALVTFGLLGYRPEGDPFTDDQQGIRGQFAAGDGLTRIELLENLPGSGTVDPWLAGGSRMYHLAFFVPEIGAASEELTAGGAKVVRPPMPSVAFNGRAISFLILPNRCMVELVDTSPPAG